MTVYFIRPIDMPGAPVKIGWSNVPASRLDTLASWSPYRLEIAATTPGGRPVERRIHGVFAAQHSHREWFRTSPELDSLIARLAAGEELGSIINLQAPIVPFRAKYVGYITEDWRRRASYAGRLRWAFWRLREAGAERFAEPDDVSEIMWAWTGRRGDQAGPPNAEQLRRLEDVLANPGAHAVVASWLRDKAA